MAGNRLSTDDHHPENGYVSSEAASPAVLRDFDGSVLPFLGGLGKFQKQLILLTWIPALFICFSQFSDNFLLAQPDYVCKYNTPIKNNVTESAVSPPIATDGVGTTQYFKANHSEDELNNPCSCTEWNYTLHTGLVQNVVTKFNLVCDSNWKVHIAKFSLLVGSIFGYLVMGVLADWFGRQPILIISVIFILVFGLTVGLSVDVTMFSTLRFFEGFCLAGVVLSLYITRIEICPPSNRFMVTMVASFISLGGQLLMPGLAAICRDWQILQAVIICPFILMISFLCIFPESLRWLLATQDYDKAKSLVHRIIHSNRIDLENDEKGVLSELEKDLPKKPKKTCIARVVGTRNLWKNILVLCVNSLTGFGIHHCFARSMMGHEGQTPTLFQNFYAFYYITAGIAVASCLAMCPAVGFLGRRGGLLMFTILTALASLLQLGLLNLIGKYNLFQDTDVKETMNKKFSIAFSIIGMFSSHAVGNLSIFFCAEIAPTVIRGGGLGLVLASAGFGMITAPIMDLHNQKGYFLHHVIFACCTLICIICILLLPESRHQNLPETIADGEGYMRQPLLPPKKGGEQPLLLTNAELKDYSGIHETPVHQAACLDNNTANGVKSS
ncbi:solute carrier family 22 member 23 [Polypterus senegalus]|uniref:solute carrier family 22 member 23 n=1 Tax=Polypterus senegalus TaxID=55291 RepID=UPI001963885E|nr:solute carrier family 22 member 23 [Polypterus senegalus]